MFKRHWKLSISINMIKLIYGDCLDEMKTISDNSVDMLLCDLPYGTTSCKWDIVIPFDLLWEQYKRISKGGCIALFGSEPFSSYLRLSNIKWYKYDWIWNKKLAGNGILVKKQPLKIHEIVSIFYKNNKYFPQMIKGKLRRKMTNNPKISEINGGDGIKRCKETFNDLYYPVSIQTFSSANLRTNRLHPTQKPVELLSYLIKTYSEENDTILDNCMGSGSVGVACKRVKRNFIGIEKDEKYFNIAKKRITEEYSMDIKKIF